MIAIGLPIMNIDSQDSVKKGQAYTQCWKLELMCVNDLWSRSKLLLIGSTCMYTTGSMYILADPRFWWLKSIRLGYLRNAKYFLTRQSNMLKCLAEITQNDISLLIIDILLCTLCFDWLWLPLCPLN